MKLEDQVISLDLAKRMKELGFVQESLWYWVQWIFDEGNYCTIEPYSRGLAKEQVLNRYSAYTVSELGEMLPMRLRLEAADYWLRTTKGKRVWDIRYCSYSKSRYHNYGLPDRGMFQGDTESDCRAKMLIYLKEKNLL